MKDDVIGSFFDWARQQLQSKRQCKYEETVCCYPSTNDKKCIECYNVALEEGKK